jgi:hypothetical protein
MIVDGDTRDIGQITSSEIVNGNGATDLHYRFLGTAKDICHECSV